MTEQANMAAQAAPGRRMLAATDLSSRSDRALRRAAMLAQAAGAELLVLHAIDDDQPRSLVEAERREALVVLREQVAGLPELRAGGATLLIEEGDPFEAILRSADAKAVDLVVLGEHRRRVLRDIFAGTTVERVMRHGQHPVLMVNQPPAGTYRHAVAATDLSEHSACAIGTALRLGLLDRARLTVVHAFEPMGMFADETTMPVLDPGRGRTKKGYAWAIARDDRSWGGADPPAVVFHYAPGRGAEHAKALLAGYRGVLQCDGYGAYKALAASSDGITLAFCWSHVRREFIELAKGKTAPIATETLQRIAALYAVETDLRGKPPHLRRAGRQERSRPLVEELFAWLTVQLARLPGSSPTA